MRVRCLENVVVAESFSPLPLLVREQRAVCRQARYQYCNVGFHRGPECSGLQTVGVESDEVEDYAQDIEDYYDGADAEEECEADALGASDLDGG